MDGGERTGCGTSKLHDGGAQLGGPPGRAGWGGALPVSQRQPYADNVNRATQKFEFGSRMGPMAAGTLPNPSSSSSRMMLDDSPAALLFHPHHSTPATEGVGTGERP